MSSVRPSWLRPRLASRTGSAHQRRGVPCQDACGWWSCRDRAGELVQVLVVSDGHGGARYTRSDAGSRLACAAALREVEQGLAGAITARDPAGWSAWLAGGLPERIVSAWHEAVEGHWHANRAGAEAGFSSVPYGATLGLLVLTPHWWGHTGLGDWDLVRLGSGGAAQLVSEEADREGRHGEATFSLCMERSERHFAPRSGFHPLTPAEPPFQLLLSTDGIRKSCGSDNDFLLLAQHLAALPAAADPAHDPELGSTLDHISREGSGDDVSAVIASWGPAAAGGASPSAAAAALILQPPPLPGLAAPPSDAPQPRPAGASPPQAVPPGVSRARGRSRIGLVLGVMALAAGGGAGAAWLLALGPFAPPSPPALLTPVQLQAIQAAANTLCAPAPGRLDAPEWRTQRIRSSLNQRRNTFRQLAEAPPAQSRLALGRDPLTALIALSKLAPGSLLVEGGASPEGGTWPKQGDGVPICAELAQELAARWRPPLPALPQDQNR